jgi:hypothetical protein
MACSTNPGGRLSPGQPLEVERNVNLFGGTPTLHLPHAGKRGEPILQPFGQLSSTR